MEAQHKETASFYYQEARHLLSVLFLLPPWSVNSEKSSCPLYRKAVSVSRDHSDETTLDMLFPYERRLERRQIPTRFSAAPLPTTKRYPDKNCTEKQCTSILEPKVAIDSLKEMVNRLNESALTTRENDVWKEGLLGAVLLCAELWKILSNTEASRILECNNNEESNFVFEEAEKVFLLLEALVENVSSSFSRSEPILLDEDKDSVLHVEAYPSYELQREEQLFMLLSDAKKKNLFKIQGQKKNYGTTINQQQLCDNEEVFKKIKYDFLFKFGDQNFVKRNSNAFQHSPEDSQEKNCYTNINFLEKFSNYIQVPDLILVFNETIQKEDQKQTIAELQGINDSLEQLKKLTEDLTMYSYYDSEQLNIIENTTVSVDVETRRAVVDLAKASKQQKRWWSFGTSGAGMLGGSLLSLSLGPLGVAAGGSIGGVLGYKAGHSVQKRHEKKMDRIIYHMKE